MVRTGMAIAINLLRFSVYMPDVYKRQQWWAEHEFRQLQPENQTEHLEHHVYGGYHEIYVREIFQDDVWRANGNKLFTTRMGRKDRR